MDKSKKLIKLLKKVKKDTDKRGFFTLLNWNVCVKMDNTEELAYAFNQMDKNNVLPDIFVTQEAVKRLDENALSNWDTCDFVDDHYENVLFDATFSTRFFEKKGGGVINVGGEVAQGQLTSTNLKVLDTYVEFFVGKFEKLYEKLTIEGIMAQPRLYQATILELPNGGCVQIVNLHGAWNSDKTGGKEATKMVKNLISDFKDSPLPTIIVGDFNLIPTAKEIAMMSMAFTNVNLVRRIGATRPVFQDGVDNIYQNFPQTVVDYIFVNDKIILDGSDIFVDDSNMVSDHFPLVFSFNCEKVVYDKKIHGYKPSTQKK